MKSFLLAPSGLLIVIGWLLIADPCQAQITLQGIVQNGADNSPLPFANVFLANTTIGTISAEDGKFLLKNAPKGRLVLIISCVGFETLTLSVQTDEPKRYRLILKPAEDNLLNVMVRANEVLSGKKTWLFLRPTS